MQMRNWITGVTVAVGLAFGMSTGASALVGTVPGSPLNFTEFSGSFGNTIVGNGASVLDQWEFEYGSGSLDITLQNDTGGSTAPNPPWESNIAGLTLKIFEDDDNTVNSAFIKGVQVGPDLGAVTTATTAGTGNQDLTLRFFKNLFTPGDVYFLEITGTTTGLDRGIYNIEVNTVPLPPAIWLFLSALVGLVSFARIRRNGTPA